MGFFISAPLLELTALAGLSPERIDTLMERRRARRIETLMRPGHYYPSTLARRTGVPVVALARRHRSLLMTVENRHPFWAYREFSRNVCELRFPMELPRTMLAASVGRNVGSVAQTKTQLDALMISDFGEQSGWTVLKVAPPWVGR